MWCFCVVFSLLVHYVLVNTMWKISNARWSSIHTHHNIYIYMYIYIKRERPPANNVIITSFSSRNNDVIIALCAGRGEVERDRQTGS